MKKEEIYYNMRKISGSDLDVFSSKMKESKLPKKIFTFSKEYLKKIETEKESLQFECEITKISQKGEKRRFFKFFKNGILCSKVKKEKNICRMK